MDAVVKKIVERWNALGKREKIFLVIVVAVSFAFLGVYFYTITRPVYSVLFSDLDPKDAAAIKKQLDKENVPYKIKEDGRVFLVPQEYVDKLRLEIAGSDLITHGTVGFEIFDKSSLGTPDYVQRINRQRAIVGELTRTLESMEEIEKARVHISFKKENSFFSTDEEKPKAAVILWIKRGSTLTKEKVLAIQKLVAAAVEGLEPSRVEVIDSYGNYLSIYSEDELRLSDKELEVKRAYEKELERKIRNILTKITGPEGVAVSVNVDLDFRKSVKESEKYSPVVGDSGVLRSRETEEESSSGSSSSGGVPGTTSNIPGYVSPQPYQGSYERSHKIENYEVNKETERIETPPGTELRSVSVSVLLDSSQIPQDKVGQVVKDAESLVKSIIGYQASRGDQITVLATEFNLKYLEEEKRMYALAQRRQMLENLFKLLVVLATGLTLAFTLYNVLKPKKEEEEIPVIEVEEVKEEISEEDQLYAEMLEAIRNLIESEPEKALEILRIWISGEY